MVSDCVGDTWYVIGADLKIKDSGQESYLAKAVLHARHVRTTGVEGKDTVFIVTRDDYSLKPQKAVPQSLKATIIVKQLQNVEIVACI